MTPEQYTSLPERLRAVTADTTLTDYQSDLMHWSADEIDRLRAEVAAMRADAEWRPIETAPQVGTAFLLGVVRGVVRVIRWGKTSHVPLYGWCLADQGPEDFDLCTPTHWRPLPTPPAQEQTP